MATRRYMLNRGETLTNVTEAVGAATATKSMEFTYDLASGLSQEDVIKALEDFKNYILQTNFPPA